MTIFFNSMDLVYGWLSNFYPSTITDKDGRKWRSAEHLYQAMKSTDLADWERIRRLTTANAAKEAGKHLPLRPNWKEARIPIMTRILERKFSQSELWKDLINTGSETLVHRAPWDSFWGDGRDGRGKNMLGKLLMELREKLRREMYEALQDTQPKVVTDVLSMRDPAAKAAVSRGDPDYVYIGRGPGKRHMMNTPVGEKGWLGNPVAVGETCPACGGVHAEAGSTLPCYEKLLDERLRDDGFRRALLALKGKRFLVCWCRPADGFQDRRICHGQVLADRLNQD